MTKQRQLLLERSPLLNTLICYKKFPCTFLYLVKPSYDLFIYLFFFVKESMTANLSTMRNILAVSAVSAGLPLSSCSLLCKPYCKLCNANFVSSYSSETSLQIVITKGGRVWQSVHIRWAQIMSLLLLWWLTSTRPLAFMQMEFQTNENVLQTWCHSKLCDDFSLGSPIFSWLLMCSR